ncbi:MAG: hypothetical protein LBI94_07020 [Treponema sp.]|jgi:hypothetical protein|nr:hypothetical protein [Treponema sp.]
MGHGIFGKLTGYVDEAGKGVPDQRSREHNFKIEYSDAIKSAEAVFFFQHPSLLSFQRAMQERKKRNNVETLFGVKEIPCDNEIRGLLDTIAPDVFGDIFMKSLKLADGEGVLEGYRVLDGGVLLALDGVWYHSSKHTHCKRCLHIEKGGETTYYHTGVVGTLVMPGNHAVLPEMPEMVSNGEGEGKQDCELQAGKRWLEKHGEEYQWLKPTLLGDDLYAHQPFCEQVLKAGYSFIFTCKDTSHAWLADTVKNSEVEE